MHFPIVREYQEDLEGLNPENKITDEPKSTPAGIWTRIIVPEHAPFFTKSLTVKASNGQPLDLGVHYQIFSIMPRLTDLAGQPVACFIELLDPDLTDVLLDYHVVGEYSLIDNRMLQMIFSAVNDDRPVFWENLKDKPVVFPPHLHSHSLIRTVICWQDTLDVMDLYLAMKAANGREPTQIRIDHFYDLLTNYIHVYSDMLTEFLTRHMRTNNEHGLTAAQVNLEKVDNFETANSGNVLQARSDQHLTPQGLETIIETFGFDSSQYLKTGLLPISRFGNTNFIPANIDGSFEGFGGFSEAAAITLESDGSLAYLWNRFDGRTTGLYYSVLTDSDDQANGKLLYTGYKYVHPRIAIDGANVNLIAQGSGEEVILVGDKARELYYIGVTNGSLDPAKHVYSPIDLRPLVNAIFTNPGAHGVSDVFDWVSVALIGQWIYIFHSASTGVPAATPFLEQDMRFKFFYRVPLASVKAQVAVTATRQNITFQDAEGVQWNNSPYHRWCDKLVDGNGFVTKCLFPFVQPCNNMIGFYRSALTLVAENPAVPGQFAMKFLTAFYGALTGPTLNTQFSYVPELNYNFDPNTGVLSLTSKTAVFPVDFSLPDPAVAHKQNYAIYLMAFYYSGQGANVLADGRVAGSGSPGFAGFPRAAIVATIPGSHTRYTTISRLFGLGDNFTQKSWNEVLTSPLASSISPRGHVYTPTGEFFIAGGKTQQINSKLFFKTIAGRFAVRPEVTNLNVGTVVSRPLTGDIRPVNALPGMGMATVVFDTASLSAYGVDVGDGAFCMSSQTKHFDRSLVGTAWPANTANPNDVLLVANHNNRIEPDGSITIVPTLEILYPEAIVNVLLAQIQFPGMATRFKFITICDPTYSAMSARAGWLPVCVSIQYGPPGGADVNTLYTTFMTIQPTYAAVNGRYQVTGFTVLDIVHNIGQGQAVYTTQRIYGAVDDYESVSSMHCPMRCRYYLSGNNLQVYMGAGIFSYTAGDAYMQDWIFSYNDRNTRRWSSNLRQDTSTGYPTVCITPDNGISRSFGWAESTGAAATIQAGPVNNAVVGSVYPQTGWVVFFKTDINVIFNGRPFVLAAGSIDLRDIDPAPQNKTFYIYAFLRDGAAQYEITTLKRLESQYQLWVGKITTNASQILTIDRYNVIAMNGHRISELKRGNSIPASSGLVNEEGQIPWFYQSEILP
jgi:hypothetical protein